MRITDYRSGGEDQAQAQKLLFGDRARTTPQMMENWRQLFPEIIGRSGPMMRVLETVAKIARSDSAVLIHGESGTGKELIAAGAAGLHRLSARSDKPFIAMNCSAIPETLLESELFGHEKGAFTGADRRRPGRFEQAQGGTIFLDEIGDMPLSLQAKLLRVLEEKTYTLLGGSETREADVRVIAATNVDLELAVRNRSFRLDLYYRLDVLPIHIPPLRERQEDIPNLLEHFIEIANRAQPDAEASYLVPEVVDLLTVYPWPGNVRQLQNLVKRLVVMRGGGRIGTEHLPNEFSDKKGAAIPAQRVSHIEEENVAAAIKHSGGALMPRPTATTFPEQFGSLPHEGIDLVTFIESLENSLIMQALERTGHNKNQAARLLGLNRTTLVERIKKRKILPLNAPSKEL
jgi:transcriptional regulator with PAS, ATPase and Fis domain